jgi:hypothetical protein
MWEKSHWIWGFLKCPNTSNFQNLDISLHYLTWNIYIYIYIYITFLRQEGYMMRGPQIQPEF